MIILRKVYEEVKKFEKNYPGELCWRLKSHCKVVESYIDPDEEILLAFGCQKYFKGASIFNSVVFVLTNKRIMLGKKKLLVGSTLYSITPDMYNDMQIYKGLFWGKITIDTVKEEIKLTHLAKSGLDKIETVITNFMIEAKKQYQSSK